MRTLRTLGGVGLILALLAIIGAGSASASELKGEIGEPIDGGSTQEFVIHPGNQTPYSCGYTGFESETRAASTSSLTVDGFGGEFCQYIFGQPRFEMNGCTLTFHFGSDAGHFGRYSGTYDIGPSTCGGLTVGGSWCHLTVPPQEGLAASFENVPASESPTGKKAVHIISEAENVSYTLTHSGLCTEGSYTNGRITGAWNMYSPTDLYLEENAHTPTYEAEQYPATEVGAQDAANKQVIKVQGSPFSCKGISYSGSLSAASATTALTPTYSECNAFGFLKASGNANGCSFVMHAGEAVGSGKYKGTEDIACPVGKAIEITAETCKVSIPAQEGLGVVESEDVAKEGKTAAKSALAVSSLKYTVTSGFLCPLTSGSYSNGVQTGGLVVQGKTGAGALQGFRIGG